MNLDVYVKMERNIWDKMVDRKLSGKARFIYVAMAGGMVQNSNLSESTYEELKRRTEIKSDRTISRYLRELKEKGFISLESKKGFSSVFKMSFGVFYGVVEKSKEYKNKAKKENKIKPVDNLWKTCGKLSDQAQKPVDNLWITCGKPVDNSPVTGCNLTTKTDQNRVTPAIFDGGPPAKSKEPHARAYINTNPSSFTKRQQQSKDVVVDLKQKLGNKSVIHKMKDKPVVEMILKHGTEKVVRNILLIDTQYNGNGIKKPLAILRSSVENNYEGYDSDNKRRIDNKIMLLGYQFRDDSRCIDDSRGPKNASEYKNKSDDDIWVSIVDKYGENHISEVYDMSKEYLGDKFLVNDPKKSAIIWYKYTSMGRN